MKVFTYSDARQNFSSVLNSAKEEGKVLIKRRDGSLFSVRPESEGSSPFDVPGVKTMVSTEDILKTLKEERGRTSRWS
jgi:hypothetical protein